MTELALMVCLEDRMAMQKMAAHVLTMVVALCCLKEDKMATHKTAEHDILDAKKIMASACAVHSAVRFCWC